jgi:hypothetical protein
MLERPGNSKPFPVLVWAVQLIVFAEVDDRMKPLPHFTAMQFTAFFP